jgi:hypothetical protein
MDIDSAGTRVPQVSCSASDSMAATSKVAGNGLMACSGRGVRQG